MIILDQIHKIRENKRIVRRLEGLEANCVIGRDFCGANWKKRSAVLGFMVSNRSGNRSAIQIGDYCNLNGLIDCNKEGRVRIGNYVFSNKNLQIRCDYEITVGNYCMFGPNVCIWDTRNHPMSVSARRRQAIEIPHGIIDSYEAGGGPIVIEDDVWLGLGVVVLHGVRIGAGSIIGAGAVVTRDVPAMSFAAGVPAEKVSDVPE